MRHVAMQKNARRHHGSGLELLPTVSTDEVSQQRELPSVLVDKVRAALRSWPAPTPVAGNTTLCCSARHLSPRGRSPSKAGPLNRSDRAGRTLEPSTTAAGSAPAMRASDHQRRFQSSPRRHRPWFRTPACATCERSGATPISRPWLVRPAAVRWSRCSSAGSTSIAATTTSSGGSMRRIEADHRSGVRAGTRRAIVVRRVDPAVVRMTSDVYCTFSCPRLLFVLGMVPHGVPTPDPGHRVAEAAQVHLARALSRDVLLVEGELFVELDDPIEAIVAARDHDLYLQCCIASGAAIELLREPDAPARETWGWPCKKLPMSPQARRRRPRATRRRRSPRERNRHRAVDRRRGARGAPRPADEDQLDLRP